MKLFYYCGKVSGLPAALKLEIDNRAEKHSPMSRVLGKEAIMKFVLERKILKPA